MCIGLTKTLTTAAKPGLALVFLLTLSTATSRAQTDHAPENANNTPLSHVSIPKQTDAAARAIIDKHLQALGGQEKLDTVQSIRLVSRDRFYDTDTWGVTTYYTRSMNFRQEIDPNPDNGPDHHCTTKGFNGEAYWEYTPSLENKPMIHTSSETLNLFEDSYFIDPFIDWEANGLTFEYVGEQEISGKKQHVLKAYRSSRHAQDIYIDADTLHLTSIHQLSNPASAITDSVIYPSNYEQTDGIWYPTRTTVIHTGEEQPFWTSELLNIEINPEIAPGFFDPPAPQAPADQPSQP